MLRVPISAVICLLIAAFATGQTTPTTQPIPLLHVHAHNDYLHEHPLFDAMDRGYCSVEADIHLVGTDLLVAHDAKSIQPGRTLQSLYLDPMRQRIGENGGRLYRNGPPVVLLIDVKTPFNVTYPVLRNVLAGYADVLTSWKDGQKNQGAILAIVTGNRDQKTIAADNPRWCACDGGLADFQSDPSADLVPWISIPWKALFVWKAKDRPIPAFERQEIKDIVTIAHAQHRQVRFWGSPDNLAAWTELRSDDVDLLNTEDLPGCQTFLLREIATGK
jgi:hypothetical protein